MMKILNIALFGCLLISCSTVKKKNYLTTKSGQEKYPFAIDSIKKNYPSGYINKEILPDGTRIVRSYFPELINDDLTVSTNITMLIEEKHSTFGFIREYFISGKLKSEGPTFWGTKTGIHQVYDQSGKLLRQDNYDNKFSVTELIRFVHENFNKDITVDTVSVSFTAGNYLKLPVYVITFPLPSETAWGGNVREVVISEKDGSVVSNKIIPPKSRH